jgi:hypothetical protein
LVHARISAVFTADVMSKFTGMPSPLDLAKVRFTIYDLAARLYPDWKPAKSCHSPFREDRNPSFSVFDEGRKWKDFSTGEHGDVIDFLAQAQGISPSDAARNLIAIAGTRAAGLATSVISARCKPLPASGPPRPSAQMPNKMPDSCRDIWEKGRRVLGSNLAMQHHIEQWRGWPAGVVQSLVEDELIACPNLNGSQGIAFPVQAPSVSETGALTTYQAGFHFRHKPADQRARAKWSYHPTSKECPGSFPALPFVLGAGFVPTADSIVVCEGQWDVITLAVCAGWLTGDNTWPENVAVFGTRGAEAWKPLLGFWGPFLHKAAHFVLFADADRAGDRWRAPGQFVESLRDRGHSVRLYRSTEDRAKDLNDLHRSIPITPQMVADWVGTSK